MEWQKISNSLILIPDNQVNLYDFNNFKISSNICDLHFTSNFTLDDISNILYNISSIILSTSTTPHSININGTRLLGYIHNIKILVSIRIDYKCASGIKTCNLSSSIGDFFTSSNGNSNIHIYPELLCLWLSSNNNFNLTLTYALVENSF